MSSEPYIHEYDGQLFVMREDGDPVPVESIGDAYDTIAQIEMGEQPADADAE